MNNEMKKLQDHANKSLVQRLEIKSQINPQRRKDHVQFKFKNVKM